MMKIVTVLSTVVLTAGLAQAGMYVNVGVDTSSVDVAGQGPTGANANYLAYQSDHETAAAGAEIIYNGVSFSEDSDLTGTYDVGLSFSWPGATADTAKQAFNRTNVGGYDPFWENWVGIDTRDSDSNQFVLSLTGLEANQEFSFTSYHFDTQNQAGTFTVDQTLSASETATSPFDFPRTEIGGGVIVSNATPWIDNAYTFDVTSDASGNLDITYAQNSGTWIGINGFDLVAVPEPATLGLVAVFGGGVLFIRRRFMM